MIFILICSTFFFLKKKIRYLHNFSEKIVMYFNISETEKVE